ncbi:MAG TPA: hypothetical protein PLT20_11300, partial [Sedimentisphaerales bacterium]|nr:hypothetical protein [Sedimentisphaerales bacterium]
MKRLLCALVLLVACAGCEPHFLTNTPIQQERPTVNVPRADRQANWLGNQREGSCVHASVISLLRWQGRYRTADYWRRTYGNGEWPEHMAATLDREKIRYAYVTNGDVKFL